MTTVNAGGRCRITCAATAVLLVATAGFARQAAAPPSVRAIARPLHPLPPEAATAGVDRFSFVVYGDTRGRKDGVALQQEHAAVVDSMLRTIRARRSTAFPVRFVLQTGDAVVDGRDAAQWNVSFVKLIDRVTRKGGVPYFLAPGNHDVTGAPSADDPRRRDGLRHYLQAVAELIPPDGAPRRLAGYPTYAFGYGNTFVVALDSNIALDDTQYEWVRAQLEGIDRGRYAHVIVFFHHPTFSSGPHGGTHVEGPPAEMRGRYMRLFRAHHVDVLFSGHEHFYEHWVERYTDEAGVRRRLDHVVTGGGGAPHYAFQSEPDTREYREAYAPQGVTLEHLVRPAPVAADNPDHYVVVTVDGARLRLEVVGVGVRTPFTPYGGSGIVLSDEGAAGR